MKTYFFTVLTLLASFSVMAENAEVNEQVKASALANVKIKSVKENRKTTTSNKLENMGEITLQRKSVEKIKRNATFVEGNKQTKKRAISPVTAKSVNSFTIYDAWISLDDDFDADGYYSGFTVSFDADVASGSALVYAEIYISQNGGDWEYLAETSNFEIFGDEVDEIDLSLSLLSEFPTNEYDILIDLFEVGVSGIAATADPSTDADLYALPLEDAGYDGDTIITYVASTLSSDFDNDGFYSELSLEFDIDTLDSDRAVYMEIDLIDISSGDRRQVTSLDFTLGNQTEFVDLFFETGIPDDWFDVEIRILDFYTDEEITYAGYDSFSSLGNLPIESDDYDDTSDVEIIVVAESGGSFSGLGLLLLMIGAIRLRK